MDRLFREEKVIPNDMLKKLLDGNLESKINTSILERDEVIDVELSRAETDFFILGDEDTSEDSHETNGGHSWKSLRKKLLSEENQEAVIEPLVNNTHKVEHDISEEDSAKRDSSHELLEVKNYFKAISASSAQITQEVKKLSEHLSRKEQVRTKEDVVLDSALMTHDPFDSKLMFLLFGVMTLGLVIGLVLGVMILRIL